MTETIKQLLSHNAVIIVVFVLAAHFGVIAIKKAAQKIVRSKHRLSNAKLKSITSLVSSILIFSIYFVAIALILRDLGVSLTAYLASASVIGLAVGFGSQGIVQDVVTGITLIFSDLYDIGDMVEISGQTGIVQKIGMRFTVLENSFGAQVFIPNRTINNVINYPKGYVRCLVDVVLPENNELKLKYEAIIKDIYVALSEQFPGIMIYPPSIEGRFQTKSNIEILRIKFRIWPNRGGPIETTFKQELIVKLKNLDNNFQDWMVSANYEIERKH
jgi:small conductance mechanosensitive channel